MGVEGRRHDEESVVQGDEGQVLDGELVGSPAIARLDHFQGFGCRIAAHSRVIDQVPGTHESFRVRGHQPRVGVVEAQRSDGLARTVPKVALCG